MRSASRSPKWRGGSATLTSRRSCSPPSPAAGASAAVGAAALAAARRREYEALLPLADKSHGNGAAVRLWDLVAADLVEGVGDGEAVASSADAEPAEEAAGEAPAAEAAAAASDATLARSKPLLKMASWLAERGEVAGGARRRELEDPTMAARLGEWRRRGLEGEALARAAAEPLGATADAACGACLRGAAEAAPAHATAQLRWAEFCYRAGMAPPAKGGGDDGRGGGGACGVALGRPRLLSVPSAPRGGRRSARR